MYVKDWMSKDPIYLNVDDSISKAYDIMKEHDFHRIPIMENGKLVGIITGSTLADYTPSKATTLSIYEINSLLQRTLCKEIMVKDVVTIYPEALLEEAADKMLVNNVTCLPVVDRDTDKLVGIITQKVIFGAFVDLMGYYSKGSRIVVEVTEDIPGIMQSIAGILADNSINISHLAVYHYSNVQIVIRVYEEDARRVAEVLESNGYKVTDYRVNEK